MPNELFPNRPPDGTVGDLISQWDYIDSNKAVRYLEPGRGICTAYRDIHGRYRIHLAGSGVQERPIPEEAKNCSAWWVPYRGGDADPFPALAYHKAREHAGVVHYQAEEWPRLLLCGALGEHEQPPVGVTNSINVNCIGCVSRESLLTWMPSTSELTVEFGGWYGPHPFTE